MDFSEWPAQILNPEQPFGKAYQQTLQRLAIRYRVVGQRMLFLAGTISSSKQSALHRLQPDIATIAWLAREVASSKQETRQQSASYETNVHDLLRWMAHTVIPNIPDSVTFADFTQIVTRPFAQSVNEPDEVFMVMRNESPWAGWYTATELVKREQAIAEFTQE